MKITEDFIGNETKELTKTKIATILRWWGFNPDSYSTWGNARVDMNNILSGSSSNTISDRERASSFLSKINYINDTDTVISDMLFASNEPGVWYDPSDLSTLFQDSAGTVPVTAVEQPVGRILDKSGRGFHATQTTATSRPVLRQDGSGKHYLYFDGVDDFLVTPTITPGIDKVQVFAGVRRLRAATEIIAETGVSYMSHGAFYLVPEPKDNRYGFAGRGNRTGATDDQASLNFFPPPDTVVLTATQDINGNTPARIRRNAGAWSNSINTTFGGGNFLAYPLYIGCRAGTMHPFNGHIYSMIVRFGSNLPIETIEQVEKYINGLTKAY